MSLGDNMRERHIINLWQYLTRRQIVLTTAGNEPIKIIYPGRLNHNRGADFCDAVVATNQGMLKGDIEVHIKSSDWGGHRHHQNPNYHRVILHVVWQHHKTDANRYSDRDIPTVALDKCLTGLRIFRPQCHQLPLTDIGRMPCLSRRGSTDRIIQCLDSAGDERFLAKAARFRASIRRTEADQVLYQGIMGALGYSQNKLPFLELAQRRPLRTLESSAKDTISDAEYLNQQQAQLLGTAGLLPSQRHLRLKNDELAERWIGALEKLWAATPPTEVMSPNAWNLFRVRPNNFPVRRLIAMSYLIHRYRETGLVTGMVNIIKEALPRKGYHQLAAGLVVTVCGYWACHFDFGATSQMANPSLLGPSRAADIVVNVLLPFTLAWSKFHSDLELEQKSFELYHRHPKLAANNIEQHMRTQLGLSSSQVNSARQQQGLLHIYETRCTQGKCDSCQLPLPKD